MKLIDKNLVGGYSCQPNKRWSEDCTPQYCKKGLVYDKNINQCVPRNLKSNNQVDTNQGVVHMN